jgi:hypothetical protein
MMGTLGKMNVSERRIGVGRKRRKLMRCCGYLPIFVRNFEISSNFMMNCEREWARVVGNVKKQLKNG